LETSKCSNVGLRELDQEFDLAFLALLGKLVAVVWGLGTKEIFLNTERNLFGSNQDDDEDGMRVTVDKLIDGRNKERFHTYCHEIPVEAWPASAVRSTPW
jgi:hypothetical protein